MAYKIIDVSTWQGQIDWQKVKADGVQGVILRACFGWDWVGDKQVDKKFSEYVKGAKAVGLPIGAYHYSYATNSAEAIREAVSFIKVVEDINFELPVFYDIEEKCQASLSGKILTDIACSFCETMEANGYYVGIYASTSWMKKFDYERIKRYTLWVAQYFTVCQYPNKVDMRQYTSDGIVSGIGGRVDLNHCYRDYLSEIKTRGGNPIIEQKEDENVIRELQGQINLLKNELNFQKSRVSELQDNADKKQQDLDSVNTACAELRRKYIQQTNLYNDAQESLNTLLSEVNALRENAGDFNGDGKITAIDAQLILKKVAGLN